MTLDLKSKHLSYVIAPYIISIFSVGMVLIFQFSPGFGTEASAPAVPLYRFWYLSSGSRFSLIPGFHYKVFRGLFVFFSHFGTSLVPFGLHFNPISTPNQVEPKAMEFEPTARNKEVAVFRYFPFILFCSLIL